MTATGAGVGAGVPGPASTSRLLVPALVLLTTVTSIVSSLGAPLVPSIADDAGVDVSTAQWTLTATLLVGAVSTPVVGRLGGNRRRREVILLGMLVVTAGTLLAALPLGFPFLLAGRAMQGVGIGLTPLAFAVAREFTAPARMHGRIAMLSVTTVVGAGLGYPVTATIAELLGLRAAFWFGFATCTITFTLAWLAVPRSRSTATDVVDWWGALLLSGGTAGLLLAVSQGDPWGWVDPRTVALFAASAVLLTTWVARTRRHPHPLVDLRLAGAESALAANVAALLGGLAVYVLLSMVMLQAQAGTGEGGYGLGQSVIVAGLLLVPYSIASASGSRLTAYLSRRMAPDLILPLGSALYLGASVALALWHDEVWKVALVMALAGVGSGCTFAAMPGLVVRSVPPEETGSATAFNHVLRTLGFSAGSALAVALLEVFADDGVVVDRSFTATAYVAAGVWGVTGVLTLSLALRRGALTRARPGRRADRRPGAGGGAAPGAATPRRRRRG